MNSSEMLFRSFRHSQGNMTAQLCIFRFMSDRFGIETDLHPVGKDFERFKRYLEGTSRGSSKHHIDQARSKDNTVSTCVYNGIKDLRSFRNSRRGKYYEKMEPERIPRSFGWQILWSEQRFINKSGVLELNPGSSFPDTTRMNRIRQKITSGQVSMLYYYGRDGRTTGVDEFDALYSEAWASPNDTPEYIKDELEKHRLTIADAELH